MNEMTIARPVQQELALPESMTRRVTVVRATRENLIAESKAMLGAYHKHFETLWGDRKPGDPIPQRTALSDAAFDAYMGMAGTGTYALAIAAMLRIAEEKDPELALELAALVDAVSEDGIDCIEDANDDLDGDGDDEDAVGAPR